MADPAPSASQDPAAAESSRPSPVGRREVAILFLKLGTLAFGGPAGHIALMEDEVVRRRGWLSRQQFLDLLGAANLLPGPSSTELAIYIGYRLAGVWGLLLAGVCFILPAALLVCGLAALYVRWGSLPRTTMVLQSLYPVVIAIVVQALWRLGRTAIKSPTLAVIGCAALAMACAELNPLAVLIAAGAAAMVVRPFQERSHAASMIGATWKPFATLVAAASPASFGLWPLFLVFLKFGAVIFGSGYVLLPFLQADLVTKRHWITERQLLDAVVVGQVTPGPVFTTATFIGYLLARGSGAAVATVAIFLPAFVFVLLSGPLVPRLRQSRAASAFLDGLNAGSLALMASVTLQLGRSALDHHISAWSIAIVGSILLLLTRINSLWLIVAAAIIGLAGSTHF